MTITKDWKLCLLTFVNFPGFMCHFWYNYLDRILPGKGIKVVMKKIISDQILFSPICIGSCLSVAAIVNGLDKERSYKEIMSKGTFVHIFLFYTSILNWTYL